MLAALWLYQWWNEEYPTVEKRLEFLFGFPGYGKTPPLTSGWGEVNEHAREFLIHHIILYCSVSRPQTVVQAKNTFQQRPLQTYFVKPLNKVEMKKRLFDLSLLHV